MRNYADLGTGMFRRQAMVFECVRHSEADFEPSEESLFGMITSRAPRGPGRGPPCRRVQPSRFLQIVAKTSLPPSYTHDHTDTHSSCICRNSLPSGLLSCNRLQQGKQHTMRAHGRKPTPGSELSSPAAVRRATESAATSATLLLLAVSPFLTSDGPALS